MKIDTSWSKLVDTEVGKIVLGEMDSDPRLFYHNGDHVRRMYATAKKWRLPYNATLDGSILGHDSVYDELPDKELRSADQMVDLYQEFKPVFDGCGDFDIRACTAQIISTSDHKVTKEVDSRLIKLDLAEIGDPEQRAINSWNVIKENCYLYDVDVDDAARGSVDFLQRFLLTVKENSVIDYWSAQFVDDGDRYWKSVVRGVEDAILMSETIVGLHERGFV